MPLVDRFTDLVVVPYTYLLDASRGFAHTQGGPLWPDWENSPHRHHKGGTPIDWSPIPHEPKHVQHQGRAWWAGACCSHFGHQIVDFSSKLALYGEMLAPDEQLCVATKIGSGMSQYADLPGFARSIYAYFDFGPERMHIVSTPTQFSELYSIPQQEQHGCHPATPEHLEALNRFAARKLRRYTPWADGRYYISRAQMAHGGGIAGEACLEQKIKDAGYEVIHPETMSLQDQLELYHSAAELVFQEGSALHGLQLLGHIRAKVTILVRRPRFKMLDTNLAQRISELHYIRIGKHFVCGRKPNGKRADANGILIPDQRGMTQLQEALGVSKKGFHVLDAQYEDAIQTDILAFLLRETTSHRARNPNHITEIHAALAQTRFHHLSQTPPPAGTIHA